MMRAKFGAVFLAMLSTLMPLPVLAADLNGKPPEWTPPGKARSGDARSDLLKSFTFAGGIEDTLIPQTKPGLRALEEYDLTQHYTQWRGDIDRAAELGITKLRWGVPWYRVEVRPGEYDWRWVDQVLDYMVNTRHIEPIVDVVHYGTPTWLSGSFADPDYPQRVGSFARAFAARYKDIVRYYTPSNEPILNSHFAGREGVWPPYLSGEEGYCRVLVPIARGIQLSCKAIREEDPDCALVAVEAVDVFQTDDPELKEEARRRFLENMLGWDLVSGKVGSDHPLYSWLTKHAVRPETLAELRRGKQEQDFFGVNFYPWSIRRLSRKDGRIIEEQGADDGSLLTAALRDSYEYTKKPIMITETSASGTEAERARWMDATLAAVRTVRGEGLPVVGYTWFPLNSMVEWRYRTTIKPVADHLLHLGLWDCRFDSDGILVRRPTSLVAEYRKWIKRGM